MRGGVCIVLLRSDLMCLHFVDEIVEVGVLNIEDCELDAEFEAVKLVLQRWIAGAMPEIPNPVLHPDLEEDEIRDRKSKLKCTFGCRVNFFRNTEPRFIHVFVRSKFWCLKP